MSPSHSAAGAPADPTSLNRIGDLLVTTFGLGKLHPAPGTWGSIPPCVIAAGLLLFGLGPHDGTVPTLLYHATLVGLMLASCAACIAFGDSAEARWGKDPSPVVADETAGQCIPLLLLPAAGSWWSGLTLIALAFFAFRAFDIFKPFPAGDAQRIRGPWGVLVDDLIAGLYALAIVQAAGLLL